MKNRGFLQVTCLNETRHAVTDAHQSTHLIRVINRLLGKIILRPHKSYHGLQALQALDMRLSFRLGDEIQDNHPFLVTTRFARKNEQRKWPLACLELAEYAESVVHYPRDLV